MTDNLIKALCFCFVVAGAAIGCSNGIHTAAATDIIAPATASDVTDSSAQRLLEKVMDRYAAMKTFQATCDWSDSFGSDAISGPKARRVIKFGSPNRFKVVSKNNGFTMTSVCDGKILLDMSSVGNMKYPAPVSISDVTSMQMNHPMFCGTLLYKFFGGHDHIDQLVDASKGKVSFAPDEKGLKVVRFFAAGLYGNTRVGIEPGANVVRFIRYDSEPLMDMMKKQKLNLGGASGKAPTGSLTTESYGGIQINHEIPASTFAAVLPKGQTAAEQPSASSAPPMAVGAMAPDFSVTGLDGHKVSLSSLRGKIVFLDFWATWCGPCKESLPNTQELFDHHGKEIVVMAISNENATDVKPFIQENHYTFPTFLDAGDVAGKKYGVTAIPSFIVIDATGKLAGYVVGGGQEDQVKQALRKAGLPNP